MEKNNKKLARGKIDRFFRRLKNYTRVNTYIGKENFITYPKASICSIFLLIFGVLLQVSALLLITRLLSVENTTSNPTTLFSAISLLDNLSISFMQEVFLIVSIFSLAALSTFIGEIKVLKLAIELEINMMKSLFDYLSSTPGAIQIIEKKYSFSYLSKILTGSTRLAGRVLRLQFTFIQPFSKALLLLIVLLIMDWIMTLIIVAFLFLLGIIHYRINLRAVKYSKQFEESSASSRAVLKKYLELAFLSLGIKDIEVDDFSQEKSILSNKESYRMRRQVTEESKLLSSLAKATIILFLLAVITDLGKLQSQEILTTLLSYAFVLLFFLLSLQALLVCLTNISRFHPQVSRYVNLIKPPKISLPQYSLNHLVLPIFLKNEKNKKFYLTKAATILVVSQSSRIENIHIGIISSITKSSTNPVKKYERNPYLIQDNNTPLLPFAIANSVLEIINLINDDKNNYLKIIYITLSNANELASKQPIYEYSHKMARLIPWLGNPIQTTQKTDDLEEDELDDY